MELALCVGVPASGKSSFCRERLYHSHVRINLDMLRTRRRERLLVAACVAARQRFVVDNTNTTREERAGYIRQVKLASYRVVGYYFRSGLTEALERNHLRVDTERVPDVAILMMNRRLEPPALEEGFDQLHTVRLVEGRGFAVDG